VEGLNPLIRGGPPVAKASFWNESDGEGRKLGEQRGLDRTLFLLPVSPDNKMASHRDE